MRSLPQARFQGALENNPGFRQRDDGSPFPLDLTRERTRIRRNYQFFSSNVFLPEDFFLRRFFLYTKIFRVFIS